VLLYLYRFCARLRTAKCECHDRGTRPSREILSRRTREIHRQFPLTVDGRGRTVAPAGSPLRRLRICHPADSETGARVGRTRGVLRDSVRRVAEVRGGRPRGPHTAGSDGRGTGPEEIRAAMQRRTTRGSPTFPGAFLGCCFAATASRAHHRSACPSRPVRSAA
jgi:hypothetical protein